MTDDELPLGDDVIGLLAEEPLEAFLDETPPTDDAVVAEEAELREEAADAAAEDHEHEPPSRRAVKKTRGRASVPSWDEIMFGGVDGSGVDAGGPGPSSRCRSAAR